MSTIALLTPEVPDENREIEENCRDKIENSRPIQSVCRDKRQQLLTVDEIAEVLRLKPKTIYNYVSLGVMPCIRLNNRIVRFRLDAVEKWLSKYERKGRKKYQRDGVA